MWRWTIHKSKANQTKRIIDSSGSKIHNHFFLTNSLTSIFLWHCLLRSMLRIFATNTAVLETQFKQTLRAADRVIYDFCVCAHIHTADL